MKPEDYTREELLQALARARDQQFGQWLLFAIGVCAETHPEELRAALAKVFDLKVVNDWFAKSSALATEASRRAQDARALIAAVNADIEKLEKRYDSLQFVAELLEWRQALKPRAVVN